MAELKEGLIDITSSYEEALILNQFMLWTEQAEGYSGFEMVTEEIQSKYSNSMFQYGWIVKETEEIEKATGLGDSIIPIDYSVSRLSNDGLLLHKGNTYRICIICIMEALARAGYPRSISPSSNLGIVA